jgi:hypothetical protein
MAPHLEMVPQREKDYNDRLALRGDPETLSQIEIVASNALLFTRILSNEAQSCRLTVRSSQVTQDDGKQARFENIYA